MSEDGSNGDRQDGSQGTVHRVQLDFSEEAYQRLQQLRALTGSRSNAAFIRNSLQYYGLYLEWQRDGRPLLTYDAQGNVVEIEFNFPS